MSLQQAAERGIAITPSDTVGFGRCEWIFVGGAGVVPVVFDNGSVANFTCVAGQRLDVKAIRVNSANLTASLLVAMY